MALHVLESKIYNLDWLYIKEKERHIEIKDRDIFNEKNTRGKLILTDILSIFPGIKEIKSIPQMTTEDPVTGDFEGRIGCNFYTAKNSNLMVVKHCSIPNTNYSHVITDIDLLITDQSKRICANYKTKIEEISNLYLRKDCIHEQHSVESRIS